VLCIAESSLHCCETRPRRAAAFAARAALQYIAALEIPVV